MLEPVVLSCQYGLQNQERHLWRDLLAAIDALGVSIAGKAELDIKGNVVTWLYGSSTVYSRKENQFLEGFQVEQTLLKLEPLWPSSGTVNINTNRK